MAISILNNIASLEAENQLSVTQSNLQKTLMQLSSGQRINSGADDAAGLAIANGLEANVTALNQSVQNANNGVGQLQVADGALAQVTTLLNRAVTLATESANGSVSDSQRGALQAEYSQINQEIDQIGSTTNYNGTAVFTNTAQSVFLSDGVSKSTIDTTTGALSSAALGLQAASVPTTTPAVAAQATVNLAGSVNGGNPNNGETLTIGGTVYTFVSALNEAGVTAANDQVLIGSTASATAQNLADAVNGTVNAAEWKAGTGTAGANVSVTATAAGPNVTFTAITAGAAENKGGGSAVALSSGLDAGIATASASGTSSCRQRVSPAAPMRSLRPC